MKVIMEKSTPFIFAENNTWNKILLPSIRELSVFYRARPGNSAILLETGSCTIILTSVDPLSRDALRATRKKGFFE